MKRLLVVLMIAGVIAGCVRTVVLDPEPDAAMTPDGGFPDGAPEDAVPDGGSSPDVPQD